jgi:hypothetical protein
MGRTPTRLTLRGMIAELSASVLNLLGFARQLSSQPSYQRRGKDTELVLRKLMQALRVVETRSDLISTAALAR